MYCLIRARDGRGQLFKRADCFSCCDGELRCRRRGCRGMASPAAPSPSLSPGFAGPRSTPGLSDYDLIVLAAREPEAAQAALDSRDWIGIPSPNSVRNAVAIGVAGAGRGPSVVHAVYHLRAQERLPSARHSRRENESYRAAVVAEQVAPGTWPSRTPLPPPPTSSTHA